MIIEVGEKLHVATRRFFPGDVRRYFVGEVIAAAHVINEFGPSR
jgi:hypothetical protein